MNLLLIAYRLAWEPVLGAARLLAVLERLAGRPLTPARWRLAERLDARAPFGDRDAENAGGALWLHAASLGECKGLWAFAQILQAGLHERAKEHPDVSRTRLLLTTNTVAGLAFLRGEIARASESGAKDAARTEGALAARLAPLDHPRLARRFLAAHGIRALVLFEVELWPHWMRAARRAGVPTLWISARLTERARRRYAGNRLAAGALRRVLRGVELIQVQRIEEEHALRRLLGTEARAVETGGDLRGLHYLSNRPRTRDASRSGGFPAPANLAGTSPARRGLAFVSLHAHELTVLAPHIRKALRTRNPPSPVYVFPRRPEEASLFLAQLASEGFVLHSRLPGARRVIVDSFGLVGDALPRARTAVIGGSFGGDDSPSAPIGGHNVWEPLVAGCRIIIGPHHENQKALVERLIPEGWLRVSRDGELAADADPDDGDGAATDDERARREREEFLRAERARLQDCAQRVVKHMFQLLRESA